MKKTLSKILMKTRKKWQNWNKKQYNKYFVNNFFKMEGKHIKLSYGVLSDQEPKKL